MFPGGGPQGTAGGLGAAVRKVGAAQSYGATAATAATFTTTESDTGGYFALANPSRLTAPTAGWYAIQGVAVVASGTLGVGCYGAKIQRNGGAAGVLDDLAYTLSGVPTADLGNPAFSSFAIAYLQAADYVELVLLNGTPTGGTLVAGSRLSMLRVG